LPNPPSTATGTIPDRSSALTAAEKRKRRKVLQSRENRKNKDRKTKQNQQDGPRYTDTPTADAPVASTGYVGLNRCAEAKEFAPLAELLNEKGLKLVEWDGW
jgi:hypothetical protein